MLCKTTFIACCYLWFALEAFDSTQPAESRSRFFIKLASSQARVRSAQPVRWPSVLMQANREFVHTIEPIPLDFLLHPKLSIG